jgi:hypothetical protein
MTETPEQRFDRVAGRRAQNVVKQLELFTRCGKYKHNDDQAAPMLDKLGAAYNAMKEAYEKH